MARLNDQRNSETIAVWLVRFADLRSVLLEPVQQRLTVIDLAAGDASSESRARLNKVVSALANALIELFFGDLAGVRVTIEGNEAQ
jgi:hypothetical protein